MLVMFVSVYSFGIHIKGDVLLNVEEVEEWESYVLRAIFLLVISTHTPFIFFVGKESVLTVFELLYRRHIKNNRKKRKEERRRKRKARRAAKEKAIREGNMGYHTSLNTNLISRSDSDFKIIKSNGLNNSFDSRSSDSSDSEDSDVGSEFSYQSETEIGIMDSLENKFEKAIAPSSQPENNDDLDHESDEDRRKALKAQRLGNKGYLSITLALYALVIFMSCVIDDVEIVIKFIGSMANSILNFVLPGIYYYIIMGRENKKLVDQGYSPQT